MNTIQQTPLFVFQTECIISRSQPIATGTFGGCYLLTGYDPQSKYRFLAHIDDQTDTKTISTIFEKLKELGVNLKNLELKVMGGWKEQERSSQWGKQILEQLEEKECLSRCNFELFQKKKNWLPGTPLHPPDSYFTGGVLQPDGSFYLFKTPWKKIENQQDLKNKERFVKTLHSLKFLTDEEVEKIYQNDPVVVNKLNYLGTFLPLAPIKITIEE